MTSGPCYVLGADLGTRNTGFALIERDPSGQLIPRWCRLIRTTSDWQEVANSQRAADDQRRLHEIIDPLAQALQYFRPRLVVYEEYSTYDPKDTAALKKHLKGAFERGVDAGYLARKDGSYRPLAQNALQIAAADLEESRRILQDGNEVVGTRGRGRATRTLTVVGAVIVLARLYGVTAVPHFAGQLKERFPGSGKAATMQGVQRDYPQTSAIVAQAGIPPSDQDHVYDAFGHAILAAERAFAPCAVGGSMQG